MSTSKTGESSGRYSEICGATNNRGGPCKLPAGWGTPGSGGGLCKFHGGASTGPKNTDHLEDNGFAKGNSGGGAPELNTNAEIHGGFGDWRKEYERLDDETKAWVARYVDSARETVNKHAPEVAPDRREELLREYATRIILEQKAGCDVWLSLDGSGEGRGIEIVEKTVEHNGETYTITKPNPALKASRQHDSRQRKIAKELRLYPGFQDTE